MARAMLRSVVSSSSLTSVGYDGGARLLEIEFRHGGVYRYQEVPRAVFAELMRSPSKGRYFNERIRDRYPAHEV
jgi:hypothetical protein